jgi:NhaP-type Na+/H+ or K+/H+ antiporter
MSGNDANVVVLFPWLACIIGCLVYYITSRLKMKIPYTSIMFIVGTIMGFFAQEGIGGVNNVVTKSTSMWTRIDGELLLLVFLPGLLFLDSYNINVYLFKKAFYQLLLFAFPISLCGTILTAIFANMALPYDWSINLCLLLGSVLSATDPVATAVLLDDTGAPGRLRTHIAGESLLNDGASLVFFHIFSARFENEMGVQGVEDIGWFRGIALFLRLSLGGTIVGIFFGLVLVTILFNLNRRLSREECVFQVTATIAIAYLSYFVSEALLCSGILSVVFCGLTTKMFGATLFNDAALARDFISIFEK